MPIRHAAIPTVYKGVQMRSRLEARWAAFFDRIGCKWQYEPIDLNGWIPDFIVDDFPHAEPQRGLKDEYRDFTKKPYLIEIKPITDDMRAPRDVTLEIETALGSPIGGNPLTAWDEFFKQLPYRPMLLGANPGTTWQFCNCVGWERTNGLHPSYGSIWKAAGNDVQWKSPRRR